MNVLTVLAHLTSFDAFATNTPVYGWRFEHAKHRIMHVLLNTQFLKINL